MAISSSSNNVSDARLKQFDDASGLVAKEPRILEGASSGGLLHTKEEPVRDTDGVEMVATEGGMQVRKPVKDRAFQ